MRFKMIFLALAGAAVLAAGDPLLSLDPIVTEQEAAFDPGLLGVWTESQGASADLCIFRRSGASAYTVSYVSGTTLMKFEARLFGAGDAQFLDLLTLGDASPIRVHLPVRIWIEGDTLRVALLNTDWLKEKAAQQLSSREVEGGLLLTAPGAAIRGFLARHGADDKAQGDMVPTLQRLR